VTQIAHANLADDSPQSRWRLASTDNVPVHDRAAFWSDVVCAHLVGAQCDPEVPVNGFQGHVQQSGVAGFSISHVRASGQRVVRTPAFLANADVDQFIVVIQRGGTGRMRQDGREVVLAPGDIALCSTSRVYELAFDADFWQTVIICQAETARRRAPRIDAMTAARLPCDRAAGHMLACLAESVAALPVSTPAAAAEAAAHALLDALIAFALPGQSKSTATCNPSPVVSRTAHAATLQHALDSLDQGVLVVAVDFRLVACNARGRALLRQSTSLRQAGENIVAVGACRSAFEDALRRVGRGGHPESVALRNGEASVDQVATISRMPPGTPECSGFAQPHCLVVLTSPSRQRTASVRQLMEVYALSPAEARLAHSLARGATMKEFQDEQGIKESTARTQMLSLLRKTGVNRQQELIRLLASIPSARGPVAGTGAGVFRQHAVDDITAA
jgi:DNA-binding CsgD family transcriptional regulator/PAS domain-containing protein